MSIKLTNRSNLTSFLRVNKAYGCRYKCTVTHSHRAISSLTVSHLLLPTIVIHTYIPDGEVGKAGTM